jgi:hypothetical protein
VAPLAEVPLETASAPLRESRGRRVTALEESILALKLRKAGHSYRSIAEALSKVEGGRRCSPERANRIVLKALQGLERMQDAEALQLRQLELERLDDWQRGMEGKLLAGDPKAVQAALMLQGRRLALQGMPLAAMQGSGASGGAEALDDGGKIDGTGTGLLAYAELRVGLGASGQGVDQLRAMLAQALGAGAMRQLPGPTPTPLALPGPQGHDVDREASAQGAEPSLTVPPVEP